MYTSITHTLIPLSLLGCTLAGVIRIRGDDSSSDTDKHHDDHDKGNHHDHLPRQGSTEFIGCVSRTFFNLVAYDNDFDGDLSDQGDLAACLTHCVDKQFRYTYWDGDRKQCYCSPTQRPDAEQIRDNDAVTGQCKDRDALVALNNAKFIFGGCFNQSSVDTITSVARFSTTSVRDCFTFCDQPCRRQPIEVVGATPRYDPALYDFAYDCQCYGFSSADTPPLFTRVCGIDSIFGYSRTIYPDNDDQRKRVERGEYDGEDDHDYQYGYGKGHHEQDQGNDSEHDKNKGEEDHEEDHKDHKNDGEWHEDDYSPDHEYQNGKDDGYEHDNGKGYEHGKQDNEQDHHGKGNDYEYKDSDNEESGGTHNKDEDQHHEEGDEKFKNEPEKASYHKQIGDGQRKQGDEPDYDYDHVKEHEHHKGDDHSHGKNRDDDPDEAWHHKGGKYHDNNNDHYEYDYGYYRKGMSNPASTLCAYG
ncbi:uncharacterized protein IL334_000996 [Kwoniella shivajii]|uniref:WSC domain-containing protein n=1 Tax=Kwoniella shivajii TaxID=564305 RepID=A0ABZ1CQW7_9TREE|nr:hypothetical protein IL334_000996 [Kwoniella shivajii]